MLSLMNDDFHNFEWMVLTKPPKDQVASLKTTKLIDLIQKKEIGYTLLKVPRMIHESYLDYIFKEETSGQYICQLETTSGDTKHVVGIDCDKKAIVDCSEKFALTLTRENLNYCSGSDINPVRKIIYCMKLTKNDMKK